MKHFLTLVVVLTLTIGHDVEAIQIQISGQESGEMIVDRRIAFFRGETLPK